MNIGEQTGVFDITQAGGEITAHTRCRRIVVKENNDSATGASQDLQYEAPVGAAAIVALKGTPIVFTAPGPNGAYYPGQTVGKVAVIANATIHAQQLENQEL